MSIQLFEKDGYNAQSLDVRKETALKVCKGWDKLKEVI